MKNQLQIIEQDNLFGLADAYNHEIVECIYDQIKRLKSGKFIVIKDNMAGVLNVDGKILLLLQPIRLKCYEEIDVFRYKFNDKNLYFRFIDDKISYLDIDALSYDNKNKIIHLYKGDKLEIYNENFESINTGFEIIKSTSYSRNRQRFYLGSKNGVWELFRIKYSKSKGYETFIKKAQQYNTPDEAINAFKSKRKEKRIIRKHKRDLIEEYCNNLSPINIGFDMIEPLDIKRYYLGNRNGLWGIFRIKYTECNGFETIIKIEPQYQTPDDALKTFDKFKMAKLIKRKSIK